MTEENDSEIDLFAMHSQAKGPEEEEEEKKKPGKFTITRGDRTASMEKLAWEWAQWCMMWSLDEQILASINSTVRGTEHMLCYAYFKCLYKRPDMVDKIIKIIIDLRRNPLIHDSIQKSDDGLSLTEQLLAATDPLVDDEERGENSAMDSADGTGNRE